MKLTSRLIQRFSVLFYILFISTVSSWAQVPSQAIGFAGGGLYLYPMGWSSEGRWGALIGSTGSSDGDGIRLLVLDAVTDEVLFRSKAMEWSGPEAFTVFWERYGRSIREKTDSFNLESTMRPDVRDAGFITGGVEYVFVMSPASPARGAYTVKIESSRGDSKDVYSSPATGIPDRSVLLGSLVSPFESRALAIIREIPAGDDEPVYRFSGAHLTQGFTALSTQPAWTATKPSSTGSLVSAVYNGQEYLVRARLAAGVDPDSEDSRGYTALLLAARLGHWQMVTDLISGGASPNPADSDGRTALHHASFAGNHAAVQALLDAGAEKSLRDRSGLVAADLAADPSLRILLQ